MARQGDDPFESTRMSLGEHLEELRRRLLRGSLAVLVAFFVAWGLRDHVDRIVTRPLDQVLEWLNQDEVERWQEHLAQHPELPRQEYFESADPDDLELRPKYRVTDRVLLTKVPEHFLYTLKISLYFAVFLGSPVLLWQLWQFVAAGLYQRERRTVRTYFPLSFGLLLTGVLFGYYVMVPYGMYFLAEAAPLERFQFMPDLSSYLTLLTGLTLALGLVFQLPLLVFLLVRVGLVELQAFSKYRPHFIVAAFAISALLTPPDPFTMFMMAVPMVLLYELGVLCARLLPARAAEAGREAGEGAA